MKLFHYDHCPYCVKVRMLLGLKNMDFQLVTLLNDDEQTPIKMIGQKMLPILQKPDGGFLSESLDIISYIDTLSDFGEPIVGPSKKEAKLNEWFEDSRMTLYSLVMPRWVKMDLEEFATPSAITYFVNKKEKMIGSFKEHLDRSDELIKKARESLKNLESFIIPSGSFFWGETLSLDDFHIFASLRCLSSVKALDFPPKINKYMISMEGKTKVPLHWKKAIY